MLDTDIIMRAIRRDSTENIIDCAIDSGWKVIETGCKCIFTKEQARVSLYFQDDDKSIFIR